MIAEQDGSDFRRILVALDASRGSLAALEEAARLASRLEAELWGLFIEDIDLINLAALPFSREAPALARTGRVLDTETVEHELRCKAGQARRAMERVAQSRHLRWSFRVARGRVEAEIGLAAREVDLIAIGKGSRPLTRDTKWGQTARALATSTARPILFAAIEPATPDAPLAVYFDGSEPSQQALATAARLALRDGKKLIVLLASDQVDDLARLELSASKELPPMPWPVSFRRVGQCDAREIMVALGADRVGLLIVNADSLTESAVLGHLIEKSGGSVLLLRR